MNNDAQRIAAVEVAKHRRLLSTARSGRILSALMLPLLRWWPPAGFGVLTTTGRKTGLPRHKCVRVIRQGNRAYLVALRPPHVTIANPDWMNAWVHNIRADSLVQLRVRGAKFEGIAHEIIDSSERVRARTLICENVYLTDYGECALHLRGWPSRTKIKELHRYWFQTGTPVSIELWEGRP